MKLRSADGSAPRAWSPESTEAEQLLELMRAQPSDVPAAAEQRFLSAFREQTTLRARRSWWRGFGGLRYALAVAGALVVALAIFRAGTMFEGALLSYRVKSGAAMPDRLIDAKSEPVELDFSDGTVVTVDRGSRARVTETTRRGARFRLESGRMLFDVVPHPDRGRWLVEAGPFQVRVTGTVFTVEWNAGEGSLRVEVTRGHVIVEGAGQRRELGPGDSFHHREASAAPAESARPVVAVAPEDAPALPAPSRAPTASVRAEKPPSWSALVASGAFTAVIDAANRRGVDDCLDDCSQEDLRALSDAARLSGHAGLSERALLAQRRRFGGSADAVTAAFLLGRAAEAQSASNAVSWYDKYLAEAPQGRFAGDALGRKLVLLGKSSPRLALPVAQQYLARFPTGPYVSHARSVVEAARRGR